MDSFKDFVPSKRPELPKLLAMELLAEHQITGPAILGRRGYYRDALGKPGVNDWSIYDDAIVVVTPTSFVSYNANCDPSRHHPGVAVLEPGVWLYRLGIHNQSKPSPPHERYAALVQADEVIVHREGTEHFEKTYVDPAMGQCLGDGRWQGFFGINIHHGAYHSTSSEGCQTIYPDQWDSFITLVQLECTRHQLTTIPYVLTEREDAGSATASTGD